MRKSVIFYRSFYEAIREFDDENLAKIFRSIMEYGLDGNEPNLPPILKGFFILIQPQIDANNNRYENGKKGAEYGKSGGRPKKTETPQADNENPTETPQKPLNNPTETPKEKEKEKVKDKKKDISIPRPTLEEVKKYFLDNKFTEESAERFFRYYDTTDWHDKDGNRVKNWKLKAQAVWFKDENKKIGTGYVSPISTIPRP